MYLQISSVSGRCCVRLGLFGAIVGSAIAFGSPVLAQVPPDSQIVPDNTLGADNSRVSSSPDGTDTISGGATRGGNLFHSFDRFSIPNGREALFDNGANIQNILTRVTGGSVSDIDGILAARGAANLFLLNPNGIIFGQNARLNISGSFIATTASSINFADGTQFSATPGTGAPLLTVSVPLGLQFGAGAGEIVNRSQVVDSNNFPVGLQVDPGKTLGLIGGNNVNLEGSRLTARGGRVELGAVAAPGVVGISPDSSGFRFSFPTDLALGDLLLTADTTVSPTRPTFVNVRSGGGGGIAVNARNLSLFGGSELLAGISGNQGSASAVAGNIEINAQGTVTIDGLGQFPERFFSTGIYNSVEEGGTGKGGDVNITASSLFLRDRAVIAANTTGQGDAGNIQITATNPNDSILLEGGSFIQTDSFSQSNAGNVTITADGRVSFVGFGNTGVSSGVFSRMATEGGIGKSGSITIKARSLSLDRGAQINTSTSGQGDAGNVNINVDERVSLANNGRVFSQVESTGAGKGGNITISARSLSLDRRAQINTSTSGQGDAGDIRIAAIDPVNSIAINNNSFVRTSSSGSGNAGDVTITADGNIYLETNSYITSSLNEIPSDSKEQIPPVPSDRRGGDINVEARSLSLSNGAFLATSTSGQGNAGNIQIDVIDSLSASGGSSLEADSSGIGNGGNVTITAGGSITFDGIEDEGVSSGVASRLFLIPEVQQDNSTEQILQVAKDRRGGDITIKARSLSLLNGAQIGASTFSQGNAGSVNITVDDTISIEGYKISSEDKRIASGFFSNVEEKGIGKGGNINVKTGSLLLKNRAVIAANTSGQGDAGSIQIIATNPNNSIMFQRGSYIQSDSFSSQSSAGDVTITTDGRVTFTDVDGASSGVFSRAVAKGGIGKGGNITIKAKSLSLDRGAQIDTNTSGQGNAGNIEITAVDPITSITVKGGSLIETDSFGTGNAGNVKITANGDVSLDANSSITSSLQEISDNSIGQISQVPSDRKGGDINIKARSLSLNNGAQVGTSTISRGNAGNIDIRVDDTISFDGVGESDSRLFRSGVFSNVQEGGKGKSGNINVRAGNLSLTNGGIISASTLGGEGDAGSITVDVSTLNLDNGVIVAISESSNGGDIELRASKRVRLRNGSQISTSAGGIEQSGNGGNITINSPLVIANANGNNDITANAFRGSGGRIEINAQGIFGLTRIDGETLLSLLGTDTPSAEDFNRVFNQLSSNDVAAISLTDPSLSNVSFNTADIDPSRDIVELPTGIVDASSLVAAGCPSGAENRFTVAGRGGLPPAPADKLSPDALLTDWATLQTPETQNRATVETTTPVATNTTLTPPVETITEATSWQYDRNGAIILTSGDTTSSSHLKTTPTSCPSS